jgi:hypothetical protein
MDHGLGGNIESVSQEWPGFHELWFNYQLPAQYGSHQQ